MFSSDFIQQLLIAIPAILLALTFHEVAHGWMADKLDRRRYGYLA